VLSGTKVGRVYLLCFVVHYVDPGAHNPDMSLWFYVAAVDLERASGWNNQGRLIVETDLKSIIDIHVQLNGIVTNEDGGPGPATLAWTVIAEPNELNPARISDPVTANPTVTAIEPGTYTIQLEACDGEYTTADTMQIVLYTDACERAKNQERFALIPGDINED